MLFCLFVILSICYFVYLLFCPFVILNLFFCHLLFLICYFVRQPLKRPSGNSNDMATKPKYDTRRFIRGRLGFLLGQCRRSYIRHLIRHHHEPIDLFRLKLDKLENTVRGFCGMIVVAHNSHLLQGT